MLLEEIIQALSRWFVAKASLYHRDRRPFFKEGELWWCSIGMNVGREKFGKGSNFARPVLIFKKISEDLFLGLPITRKNKKGSWYVEIRHKGQKRAVMLNQARVFDRRRLLGLIGTLGNESLAEVRLAFAEFYSAVD